MEDASQRFCQPFGSIRIVSDDAKNSWSKDQTKPEMEKKEESGYKERPTENESS